METKTEMIKNELINAVDNPSILDKVIRSHSNSKGPLYIALAQSTNSLIERLKATSNKCREVEKEYQERQERSRIAKHKLDDIEKAIQKKNQELSGLDEKLKDKKTLLDQAKALCGLGFGLDKLSRLHNLLVQIGASQGAKQDEALSLFFQLIDRYEKIVSLELEVKRAAILASQAKAEMERWQAEAQSAEVKSRARKSIIDITEKMLAQGIKESDILNWTQIISEAGVSAENMAKALQRFTSIEKLCHERENQTKKLGDQLKQLAGQVKALNEEREQVSSAILAIREKALAEIETMSKKAMENVEQLMSKSGEYVALQRQAATLEQELVLARAIKIDDPVIWKQVSRQAIRELVAGLIRWCRVDATHYIFLPSPPRDLKSRIYFYFQNVSLEEILYWALLGLAPEEDKKALPYGRDS